MNLSEIFIRRPIATSLLMAAIALFGVIAYRGLPVSDLPTVDFPTISVGGQLPGGDPVTMAASIASPLERQFTTIAAAMPLLPPAMPTPPSFRKVNPADQPIMQLNLTSDTLEMSKVDGYAEDIIAPRISMVSGVSQVNVQGAQRYAVRVQVDPDKLEAQKVGINEVNNALANWN